MGTPICALDRQFKATVLRATRTRSRQSLRRSAGWPLSAAASKHCVVEPIRLALGRGVWTRHEMRRGDRRSRRAV